MMGAVFERTLPADLLHLSDLLDGLAAFLVEHQVPGHAMYGAQLVCEELVSNSIRHGHDATRPTPHQIHVRVGLGHAIDMWIEDDARPFDPTSVPEPPPASDIADAPIGGRGISLVRSCTSRFVWRFDGSRNCIELTVPLATP